MTQSNPGLRQADALYTKIAADPVRFANLLPELKAELAKAQESGAIDADVADESFNGARQMLFCALVRAADKARNLIGKIEVHGKNVAVAKAVQEVLDQLNPLVNNLAEVE